jgi:serine protease Do
MISSRHVLAILLFFFSLKANAQLPDFTKLVEKYGDTVVNISTYYNIASKKKAVGEIEIPGLTEENPLNDLFRHFFREYNGKEGQKRKSESLGSGFIISNDGYILTNNHVVANADEVVVRLFDRRELVAEVIGKDARSDIALLKIDANDLPTVKIGNSSQLKPGEWVLAIGSPFGFEQSVTAGIVSATGRSLPDETYVPFIQTDVAINPGNSGGPLFNLDGEVVGVNAQIYSRTGGFMGLSFTIPIDMAMDVVAQLKDSGHVSRGWLGVLIQEVTRELAESFDMPSPHGALIAKVYPNSPAEKAGFLAGDIISIFNGNKITRSSGLPPIVGQTPVNSKIPVHVIRSGKKIELTVIIEELPDEKTLSKSKARTQKAPAKQNALGIQVADISDEEKQSLKIHEQGVIIEKISSSSAKQAGLVKGDIILSVNHKKITTTSEFDEVSEKLESGKLVPILIRRKDQHLFIPLRVPK